MRQPRPKERLKRDQSRCRVCLKVLGGPASKFEKLHDHARMHAKEGFMITKFDRANGAEWTFDLTDDFTVRW